MPLLPETPIRFLKRLLWWPPATVWWLFWEVLWKGFRIWMLIPAVVFCVPVTVGWPCPVERKVRLMGMVLQLLGFGTIVWRLWDAQRQFRVLEQAWRRCLQALPRFRAQHTIISAMGAVMEADAARPRVRVNPYNFRDPGSPDRSKSETPTGTPKQEFFPPIRTTGRTSEPSRAPLAASIKRPNGSPMNKPTGYCASRDAGPGDSVAKAVFPRPTEASGARQPLGPDMRLGSRPRASRVGLAASDGSLASSRRASRS
jgi:hypothetical protein